MLKLIQTDWGQFDLAFDDPANADADAAVATLIYTVLFTDAEAPASREPDAYLRRGWWADEQAGTGLWHVRRQALSSAARSEALMMVQTALVARAPALTDIEVRETSSTEPVGNVSSVQIVISGYHNGRKFAVKAAL